MKDVQKQCTVCNEVKDLSGFYIKSKGAYGVDSKCKQCVLKLKQKYYAFKLKAKSGEITLMENEPITISQKAVMLFLKMQER